jgi:hypothetical protein
MTEDNEYEDIREKLKDLIQKGQEAIDGVKKLTEDADTFEVAADKELYNPDEFVLEDVKMVHWENMDTNVYWCGIYLNDGRIFHLHIGGDNLRVSLSDETPDELAQGHSTGAPDAL